MALPPFLYVRMDHKPGATGFVVRSCNMMSVLKRHWQWHKIVFHSRMDGWQVLFVSIIIHFPHLSSVQWDYKITHFFFWTFFSSNAGIHFQPGYPGTSLYLTSNSPNLSLIYKALYSYLFSYFSRFLWPLCYIFIEQFLNG